MKINLNFVPPYTTLNSVQSYITLCTATCVHLSVQQHNNSYANYNKLCITLCTMISMQPSVQ